MGNAYADTSDGTGFPAWTGATFQRAQVLRYGENPHQRAALYIPAGPHALVIAQAELVLGKKLS
jgi:phosphoribosylaminoimidazolecarboxamide formyltransferase/IMP cyclohydrolase